MRWLQGRLVFTERDWLLLMEIQLRARTTRRML
jgi:hypothetical protein